MITRSILESGTPHQILWQWDVNWLRWVAIRGVVSDWAVYKDNNVTVWQDLQTLIDLGTKVYDTYFLENIVWADKEALEDYRE